MLRRNNPNIEILEIAVARLGGLADELVFLGGCATGLLITDTAAPPVRATQDVDVITEVVTWADYQHLSDQLRALGFKEDLGEGAPICRWRTAGILLDVMPTRPEILGFGNEWFQAAFETSVTHALPSGKHIRVVRPPYFIASKLAAFSTRGAGDFLASQDIQDIVAVLDGRAEIVEEILQADGAIRQHLAGRFRDLLGNRNFLEALPGHMPGDAGSQARVPIILKRITRVAEA